MGFEAATEAVKQGDLTIGRGLLQEALDTHPQYFEEVDKLNEFLAGFQHSVPGLDTVRVLDIDGNTLVKVRFGKHLPALFESMEDVRFHP